MTELHPIDLMGHYLAASDGVGPVMSLDAIDRRLATWPVGPTVWILSQLCRRVDLLRPNETAAQVALCHELFPPGTAAKAVLRVRKRGAVVISSQVVANLTLRALVHCMDDSESVVSEAHIASNVGHLLLALGDHLGSTEDTREGMALEITRLGLFYSQHDVAVWLQLGAELFLDVMPSMSGHHQFVDVDSVIQIAHGMSARRFWSLTVVQGLALRQDVGLLEVPAKMKEWNATTTDLEAWVSAWSSPLDRCRYLATTDISRPSGWSFEAFTDQPLVELFDGRNVPIRPSTLVAKGTPGGFFWGVRHPYVAQGGTHQRWSNFFGAAVEELGRRMVSDELPASPLITEAEQTALGAPVQCDLIFDEPDGVALDFVYRQFTKASTGTGDYGDLSRDLRLGVVEKVEQIDAALAFCYSTGRLAQPRIQPLVVVGGPFPLNPLLCTSISELVESAELTFVGSDERCLAPTVMDMASFRMALSECTRRGLSLGAVLDLWQSSTLSQMSFREWCVTAPHAEPVDEGAAPWVNLAMAELGLPALP